MALSDTTPGEILGLITAAGNPYHGLVTAGTLTLPNAATRPHAQPLAYNNMHYTAARALYVQVPGVVPLVRSPEQQIADAASGKQWLDYALIAGGNAYLYGRPLGNEAWIYIDPANVRWLVQLVFPGPEPESYPIAENEGATITARLRRFGQFGVAPEEHIYNVTVPSFGQDTPTGSYGNLNSYRLVLLDTTSDGSRAIYGLMRQFGPDTQAMAFVEMTLVGAGSACTVALATVRNRAQALGTVTHDERTPVPWPSIMARETALYNSGYDHIVRYEVWFKGSASQSDTGSDWPTCDGVVTTTHTIVGATLRANYNGTYIPAAPEMGELYVMTVGQYGGTVRQRAIDMIQTMYYAPGGTLEQITADLDVTFTYANPLSINHGSEAVRTETRTGQGVSACNTTVVDQTATITISGSSVAATSVAVAIKVAGATVQTFGWSGDVSQSYSCTLEVRAGGADRARVVGGTFSMSGLLFSGPGSDSYLDAGAALYAEAVESDWRYAATDHAVWYVPAAGGYQAMVASALSPAMIQQRIGQADNDGLSVDVRDPRRLPIFGFYQWTSAAPGVHRFWIARLSPTSIHFAHMRRPDTSVPGFSFETLWLAPCVTPFGVYTEGQQTGAVTSFEVPSDRMYGALHPVSNDFARSFNPICWV